MRIGRQPVARGFLAEMFQLVLGEPAFEEGARVDAGRGMTLDEHHVARMRVRLRPPEMIEAHFVERGRRGIRREVAAVFARHLVGVQHHRQRVPADVRLDAALEFAVARIGRLVAGRDRVDVGGVRTERKIRAGAARVVDQLLEQVVRALGALGLENRVDRLDPLACLDGIEVFELHDFRHTNPLLERRAGAGRGARCASMRRVAIEVGGLENKGAV